MGDMFRLLIFTQSLMVVTFRMTLQFFSHLKTLFLPATLTLCAFLRLMNSLMEPHALLLVGEIDLPIVNNYECQDKLRQTRLGQKYKLHDSFICAGGVNGKDACKGDGGSPLVCPSKYDPNTYVQAGIVAWGIGCGENGTPGVYADVSKAT